MPFTEEKATGRSLTPEEFRDAIGRFASGVTVITATDGDQRYGTTASAVSSLSLDPPMVLICMNQTSSTGRAIGRARGFAMNILGEDQGPLAYRFASKDPDKFQDAAIVVGPGGQPLLADALAALECRVVEEVVGGTHTVFLAEVDHATARSGAPLAYFRGQFGRLELVDERATYQALRAQIVDGFLRPGTRLDLREIAEQLRVAPGPLQVALGRLTQEGLLGHGDDGYEVPPTSWERVRAALDARCVIELGVIESTIGGVSEEDLRRLRSAIEVWTPVTAEEQVTWESRHEEGNDFHDIVVSLAHSQPLLDAYRQLGVPSALARAFRGYVLSKSDEAFGHEHRELVEAFEQGDRDRAREAVIRHHAHIAETARSVLDS